MCTEQLNLFEEPELSSAESKLDHFRQSIDEQHLVLDEGHSLMWTEFFDDGSYLTYRVEQRRVKDELPNLR